MTEEEYNSAYRQVESKAEIIQMIEDDIVSAIQDNEPVLSDFWAYKSRIQNFYDAKERICENQVIDLIKIVEMQKSALEKLQFSFDEMTIQLLRVDRENRLLTNGMLALVSRQGTNRVKN